VAQGNQISTEGPFPLMHAPTISISDDGWAPLPRMYDGLVALVLLAACGVGEEIKKIPVARLKFSLSGQQRRPHFVRTT
jgi:hypothetical protein